MESRVRNDDVRTRSSLLMSLHGAAISCGPSARFFRGVREECQAITPADIEPVARDQKGPSRNRKHSLAPHAAKVTVSLVLDQPDSKTVFFFPRFSGQRKSTIYRSPFLTRFEYLIACNNHWPRVDSSK